MKKTISITISGLIFHIEEDGYLALKQYLDDIHRYFANFQDGSEIAADIENRIAEIFSEKLSSGKAVVSKEEIDQLITSLGTISDFKAAEEDMDSETESAKLSSEMPSLPKPKKLERDLKNKMLGGVCAGIAYFLGIDAIWVRLLILALFFGLFTVPPFPGFVITAYIILWIAMPGTYFIEETELPTKKLLRNPKGRVFAGVAGGLSAYFGIDVTLVRVLFVALTFLFGTGLLLYFCLWIIMPKARTITDMMYMIGEPVTISGIEQRIKNQQGPFGNMAHRETLGARMVDGVGQVIAPVFTLFFRLVAVFAGILLGFIGLVVLFALTVSMAVLLKIVNPESDLGSHVQMGDLFPAFLAEEISNLSIFSAFGIGIIPVIAMLLIAISLISQQWMIKLPTALTLISIWIIAIAVFAYEGIPLIEQFKKQESAEYTTMLPMPQTGSLTLNLHDIEGEKRTIPPSVQLTVKGYAGDSLKLVQKISAKGKSSDSALFNTNYVEYQMLQVDSLLSFDSNLRLKEGGKYRIQKGRLTLYVPYNKPFRFDPKIYEVLYMTLTPAGFYKSDLNNNLFVFDKDGLKCTTCATQLYNNQTSNENENWEDEE